MRQGRVSTCTWPNWKVDQNSTGETEPFHLFRIRSSSSLTIVIAAFRMKGRLSRSVYPISARCSDAQCRGKNVYAQHRVRAKLKNSEWINERKRGGIARGVHPWCLSSVTVARLVFGFQITLYTGEYTEPLLVSVSYKLSRSLYTVGSFFFSVQTVQTYFIAFFIFFLYFLKTCYACQVEKNTVRPYIFKLYFIYASQKHHTQTINNCFPFLLLWKKIYPEISSRKRIFEF